MKTAWAVLLITALTDFMIAFATGLTVGNATTLTAYPTGPTVLYSAIGGAVVAARTIQQALKATPANTAELKGQAPPVVIPATATVPAIIQEQVKP